VVSGEDLLRILVFGYCRGGVGRVCVYCFDFRVGFGCWSVFRDIVAGWFKASGLHSLDLRFFVAAKFPVSSLV